MTSSSGETSDAPLVLVVDDDPGILATVADVLELEGYRVRTATNGREALDVLDTVTPAAIVLDMRMPIMDGWGFAKALRLADRAYVLELGRITLSGAARDLLGDERVARAYLGA